MLDSGLANKSSKLITIFIVLKALFYSLLASSMTIEKSSLSDYQDFVYDLFVFVSKNFLDLFLFLSFLKFH